AEALRAAKEATEAANRELESFSYSVAHDLRAPLRSIDGFSRALEEDSEALLDDDGKRFLGYIRESAQEMAALIDALLALSRISRGSFERRRVDLGVIAQQIIARLRRDEPTREIDIVIAPEMEAFGDERLLTALLENLLSNA